MTEIHEIKPKYDGRNRPGHQVVDPDWAYVPPVRTEFRLNLDREETTADLALPLEEIDRLRRGEFPIQRTNRFPTKKIEEALALELCDRSSLPPERCLIGNGLMSLFTYVYGVYATPGDYVIVPTPGFWPAYTYAFQRGLGLLLPLYADRYDGVVREFEFPLDMVRKALERDRVRICYLCNPNNPTGTLLDTQMIASLLRDYPEVLFVVDEAYGAFATRILGQAGSHELDATLSLLRGQKPIGNLIVARTFSKVYAMANYRVGYLFSCEENIETLRAFMGPYDMDEIPLAMALYNLRQGDYVEQILTSVRDNKATYEAFLEERGVRHSRGYRNSILVEGLEHSKAYEEKGIAVRSLKYQGGIPNPLAGMFRVTIPADTASMNLFMGVSGEVFS